MYAVSKLYILPPFNWIIFIHHLSQSILQKLSFHVQTIPIGFLACSSQTSYMSCSSDWFIFNPIHPEVNLNSFSTSNFVSCLFLRTLFYKLKTCLLSQESSTPFGFNFADTLVVYQTWNPPPLFQFDCLWVFTSFPCSVLLWTVYPEVLHLLHLSPL